MRVITLILILALAGIASPTFGQVLSCDTTERFGQTLVVVGDAERKIIELDPDHTVPLENHYGALIGYRYDFYKKNDRTVQIYVRHGVVYRICRVPDY